MMKQRILILTCGFILAACHHPQVLEISGPDDRISLKAWLNSNGEPRYEVELDDQPVILSSSLGLIREDGDFSTALSIESVSGVREVTDEYTMKQGKRKQCLYRAREAVITLLNREGDSMQVIFRVSDDGVAFRYSFPGSSRDRKIITSETSSFHFPAGTRAWLQPMSRAKTGWEHTNPSYEEDYWQDIPAGQASPLEEGWVFPSLFRTGQTWILITESSLDRHYCGARLVGGEEPSEYRIGFPQPEEVFPGRALDPNSLLPWKTPWRILAVGSLKTLVESTLGTDLAYPAPDMDFSYVEPGLASWSWALLKDESVLYDVQERFIDYAADMHWKYCLVDVNWDTRIGYDGIAELARYGKKKGVGLFLWYNSSGSWNTTPYTPRDQLLDPAERAAEFARLKEMGISGIKVDFFGGDGQSMIEYYQDIFRDAARYRLMVNCHGATLPRGWSRTYPNLVTMEAVKGFEFITFLQANADRAPTHCAMLPFTRNVFDPMDFTPVCLFGIPGIERRTTNAFELALPILFTSGIQHIAETDEGMKTVPGYVKSFLTGFPAAWDDTRFLEGYPGKLAVIARRHGENWYIGGINGENTVKELTLDLSFLDLPAKGIFIGDGDAPGSFVMKEIEWSDRKEINITLTGNGGFVIRTQPATDGNGKAG